MHYLIGRDLDADGQYEFIQDMDNMVLTEDANRALQVTKTQLNYIDMDYLNEAGFYALEADRFQVSFLEQLLFSPLVMGFRPRVAPPPRRRRRMPPPPPKPRPRRRVGLLDGMLGCPGPVHHGPRPRKPDAPRPRRAGPAPRPGAAAPAPGIGLGRGGKPARRAPGPKRDPGGRGPGR